MPELRTIPVVRKGSAGCVVIATVTRGDRTRYLKRTFASIFKQRPGVPVRLMIWANAPSPTTLRFIDDNRSKFAFVKIVPHNMGQNIAMNEMLDEAVRLDAKWFLRVDDDCFFEKPTQWLKFMLNVEEICMRDGNRYVVLGPQVNGLRNPPKKLCMVRVGDCGLEQLNVMGGICRLAPMSFMRYFRFNERMPMGAGDALAFGNFCSEKGIPILRDKRVIVTHGDSTDKQENEDPDWSYEHAMLQLTPYGL